MNKGLQHGPLFILSSEVYQGDSLIDTTTLVSKMSISQTALNSPSIDRVR